MAEKPQGKISYFFAAFGTCGTITGAGRYLEEQNPEIKIVSIEPSSSNHKLPGMKRITGLEAQFIPKILDYSIIDDAIEVTDEDAYRTAIELVGRVKADLYWPLPDDWIIQTDQKYILKKQSGMKTYQRATPRIRAWEIACPSRRSR